MALLQYDDIDAYDSDIDSYDGSATTAVAVPTGGSEYVSWKEICYRPRPQWYCQLELAERRAQEAEAKRAADAEQERQQLAEEAQQKAAEWDAFCELVRKAAPIEIIEKAKSSPRDTRFVTVLRQFFRRIKVEALAQAKKRKRPRLAHWKTTLAEATKPALVGFYLTGLRGWRRHSRKRLELPRFGASLDVFRPEVLRAVDKAALKFAQSTLDTATDEVATAIRKLREELKEGLEEGDALAKLAKRVEKIFNDPAKAERIAQTEASRAVHAGQMMGAKQDGMEFVTWLASTDACSRCLAMDGKTISIGENFDTDSYGPIKHPPLHVNCMCSCTWG